MSKDAAVEEVVDEVVVQETPEQILAAQKDGFTEANTATAVPSATEKSAEQIQADEEAKAADEVRAAETAAAAKASKTVVEPTAAEVEELRQKAGQYEAVQEALNKVHGKFGSVEAQLKKLLEAKPANIALTEEDVADLTKEYGAELSGALLKTLNKFGAKLGATAATDNKTVVVDEKADVAAIKEEFEAKRTEDQRATELKLLNIKHGDWRKFVRSYDAAGKDVGVKPEFMAWVNTLPAADKAKTLDGWDAEFLSDKIGEYKTHLVAQATALKAQQDAAEKKPGVVPKRLKTAIVAPSIPGTITTKSALDEQREGFKSA